MDGGGAPDRRPDAFGPRDADPEPRQPRQWTHPSEAGLHRRVETDRRRSRVLVLGLVAAGAGVLIGTAALAATWAGNRRATDTAAPPAPLGECLAMVEVLHPDGADPLTGLVVDDGRHVLVSDEDLEAAARLAVRVEGGRTGATVVATDPVTDLALLRLDARFGTAPRLDDHPDAGEPLALVHFDRDGRRRSTQVTVSATDANWIRPNSTVASGLIALEGASPDHGLLADASGRLAGWVAGSVDGRTIAYTPVEVMDIVEALRTDGRVHHRWIGVRATDAEPAGSGAAVLEVHADSPAEHAGLAPDDLITSLGTTRIGDLGDLLGALEQVAPGDDVEIGLRRGGTTHSATITVGEFPD